MSVQSGKSSQVICVAMFSAISSLASWAGPSPWLSRGCLTIFHFGQEAAPASPLALPVLAKDSRTVATSGPRGSRSSASADLQSCLESKLRQQLGTGGSTLFSQTWKQKATPAGRSYWAHTASVPRTSDSGFTSWPTPQTFDASNEGLPRALRYKGNAPSEKANTRNPNTKGSYRGDLKDYAGLTSWATPVTMDYLPSANLEERKKQGGCCKLKDQIFGLAANGSPAGTGNPARLNPEFCRWLMGFPPEWANCVPTETPCASPRRQHS